MPTNKTIRSKKLSQRILAWGTPLLFAMVILIQTTSFRHSKSPTFDETFYLNCALTTVKNGTLDERICGEGVAPIPILLNYLPPVWFAGGDQRIEVWEGDPSDPPLIDQARLLNSILIGIPTMLLIYLWLFRRRGYTAGLLGAALVTFSPTMTAHFSLATTDACFTLAALIALATLTCYWKNPTKKNLLWLSLTTSIAISTKYSGIFLFPCILIIMTLLALQQLSVFSKKSLWVLLKRVTVSFTLFLLFTIPLTWALHLFSFSGPLKTVPYAETPGYSAWVRVLGRGPVAQKIMEVSNSHLKRPAPFAGILFQFLHNAAGHDAYLMGDVSLSGWWYFFPMNWLLKSTPVELLLTILGFILGLFFIRDVWKMRRRSSGDDPALSSENNSTPVSNEPTNHAPIIWLLAMAVLLFMLLTSRLNLGQRYLLTLYPLLFLFTIDQFWRWFQRKTSVIALLCFVCIGFQLVSIISVQPHYLSYFNSSIGGPSKGHFYLLDSNLDWGQDLPALKKILSELSPEDPDQCLIYYFGTAHPEAYSINAHSLKDTLPADLNRWKYLALSANHLQGLYTNSKDPFAAFRSLKPIKRAGYSLFLFDVTTPAAKQALQQAITILQKMQDDKNADKPNADKPNADKPAGK
ncbi:glycosyltransferase family 39 protein [uncultured Gimesia sp.]|uniref:ArnT family glycosyltransferase n=1 Tax=uncultured Gimesia sp. TaxID=1678688 RepID=UPI002629B153|nr:glycosyltransferase family 39 protein [uncultured Gimesia sp.]